MTFCWTLSACYHLKIYIATDLKKNTVNFARKVAIGLNIDTGIPLSYLKHQTNLSRIKLLLLYTESDFNNN